MTTIAYGFTAPDLRNGFVSLREALDIKIMQHAIDSRVLSLQAKIAQLFKKQGNDLVKSLTGLSKYFEEGLKKDFAKIFEDATFETSADMAAVIQKAITDTLLYAAKQSIRNFDPSINFSLTNPRAVAYTKDHGAESVTQIDETTRDEIQRLLIAAVNNGTSYNAVARQIKARYKEFAAPSLQKHIRNRAELVAVTEIGNAYSTGAYIGAQELQDAGLAMQKSWLTSGDDRVSDGCESNQGQGWINLDTAHNSGHLHPLRFPGCRCVELYRRKK